jgi:quinol monooxygenase YgiN
LNVAAGGRLTGLIPLAGGSRSLDAAAQMMQPENVVSIHPYFRVKPGALAEARKLLGEMVARTASETANLYYDFTINGDVVFCREAYVGAEGLLKHLDNVGPVLAEFLKIAEVLRVEVHGARAHLDQLRGPLANLNPEWFVLECGVSR